MTTKGFLGIDAGTQGLSVIFTDEHLAVMATGEGHYDMVDGLEPGCYEQSPSDWRAALVSAMQSLRHRLAEKDIKPEVLSVGISGQMHGEVIADERGEPQVSVRLWCDSRNAAEEIELTDALGVKMPKRMTAARWLWTVRHRPDKAQQAAHLTTPSGWIAQQLTGQWNLGIGDAAGMFPIDQQTQDYDAKLLGEFEEFTRDAKVPSLRRLLPTVRRAGEDAGQLTESGASLLGLSVGIPVAAAEGDQPAAMAGSLIGDAGVVSVSFGTSVCANSVGDRAFQGVSPAVDHFCAADGKPINMVWLRNGTTFMNTVVEMFGEVAGDDAFRTIMPHVLKAPADCGGVLALPFMDDEPGLGVQRGGTAMFVGIHSENASAGNLAKAALLATMFNLRLGSEVLDRQGFPRKQIVLTGGLTKTPELGQVLADVFRVSVTLPASAEEGTAWGAALMAKFRLEKLQGSADDWSSFLQGLADPEEKKFEPRDEFADQYDKMYGSYRRLIDVHAAVDQAVNGDADP